MKKFLLSLMGNSVFITASFLIILTISAQTQADSFTLVKTINLNSLIGNPGAIEVDVVGDELYVANYVDNKYHRIDPISSTLLGSFALSGGILIDNHGSEYNPTTGSILHVSDDDAGGVLTYDAFFETNINGIVTTGPFDLFGPGDNSEDPNSLTVDPVTGRIWVSAVSSPGGITAIDPNNGTGLNQINIGVGEAAWALGFNPNSGNLFYADSFGDIWEIAPDGTGLSTVFSPGFGAIYGMAFTPYGDLALLDFAIDGPSQILLYDSSDDIDNLFTTSTTAPVPEPTTILLLGSGLLGLPLFRRRIRK